MDPGTAGGPGGRDRTLAVKEKNTPKNQLFFVKKKKLQLIFLHISSSYAKILRETNFHTREIPRSGSKVEDGERKKHTKNRLNDDNNNGQSMHGARKPPGPKL